MFNPSLHAASLAAGGDQRFWLADAVRGFVHPALAYSRSNIVYTRQADGTFLANAAQALPRAHSAALGFYYRMNPAYNHLCLRSTAPSNAIWTKTALNTPTQDTTGPDNIANSAWTISETSGNSAHELTQSIAFTSGTTYNIQAQIAPGSGTRLLTLVLPAAAFGSGTAGIATFSPVDGTVTKNGTVIGTTAELLANGFYLVSATATATTTASGTIEAALHRSASATVDSYTGDGTSSVKVFGIAVTDTAYPAPFVSVSGSTISIGASSWGASLAALGFTLPCDYTLGADYFCDSLPITPPTRVALQIDINGASERTILRYNGAASAVRGISVSASVSTTVDSFAIAEGNMVRQAMRMTAALDKSTCNGTIGTGSASTLPAGLTNVHVGSDTGTGQLIGGLVRAWIGPSMSDGALAAFTKG